MRNSVPLSLFLDSFVAKHHLQSLLRNANSGRARENSKGIYPVEMYCKDLIVEPIVGYLTIIGVFLDS